MVEAVFVDTNDSLASRVDAGLCTGRRFLDAEFGQTGFDSLGHAAELLDFLNVFPRAMCYLVGKRATPRVNLLGDIGLLLNIYLGVAGYTCREVGGQCYGLVKGVGVK